MLSSGSLCSPRASSSPLALCTRDEHTEPNQAGSRRCRPVWTGELLPSIHPYAAHHLNHPPCAQKKTSLVEVLNFPWFVAEGYLAFSPEKEDLKTVYVVFGFFESMNLYIERG